MSKRIKYQLLIIISSTLTFCYYNAMSVYFYKRNIILLCYTFVKKKFIVHFYFIYFLDIEKDEICVLQQSDFA